MKKEKLNIGLTEKNLKISEKYLNNLLANEMTLYIQTLNYHWNVQGIEFNDYHLLFDQQYTQIFEHIDLIAERVRAVGGQALGTMQEFINHSQIKENSKLPSAKQMVANLLKSHEIIISSLRKGIDNLTKIEDHGSVEMMSNLIEQHEKTAWMLRSLIS